MVMAEPLANRIVFVPRRLYLIRNWVTGEGSGLLVHEVLDVDGDALVVGELTGHQTRTWRGVGEYEGRPTWFCAPRLRDRRDVAALAMVLHEAGGDGGSPRLFGTARISEVPPGTDIPVRAFKRVEWGRGEEPVLTINRQIATAWRGTPYRGGDGWTPHLGARTVNRSGMIEAGRKTLRLYRDVRRLGVLPAWFRTERAAILQPPVEAPRIPPAAKLYRGGGSDQADTLPDPLPGP